MSQALLAVDGVISAEVSYDDERANVRYRPDLAKLEALLEAVDEAGFKATKIEPGDGT